ncbi:hypothetical protein [Natronosalvus caseinilyticus]|uniref:hypothetical protein n=1 Tax=Natronosalvus caseinilyticus TaxID=2953747 RepID=UPI0028A64465|nr:hypothetical protein [Natronosalvus caseinilyticus]
MLLQLQRESEIVYDSEILVAEDDHEIIDPSWSTEPAEYTLLYAADGELGMISIPDDVEDTIDRQGCNHIWVTFGGHSDFHIQVFDGGGQPDLKC